MDVVVLGIGSVDWWNRLEMWVGNGYKGLCRFSGVGRVGVGICDLEGAV